MASGRLPDPGEAARQLELHVSSGELTPDQADRFREQFESLHAAITSIRDRESELIATANKLASEAREAVITKERADTTTFKLAREVRTLVAKKEDLLRMQAEEETAEGALRMELNELSMRAVEKESEVETLRRRNEATVLPQLEALRKRVSLLQDEAAAVLKSKDAMEATREKLRARSAKLEADLATGEAQTLTLEQERMRVAAEPERLGKQKESVARAMTQVEQEITRLATKIASAEAETADHVSKRDEARAVADKAHAKLEAHRLRIEDRKRDAEELRRNIREVKEEQEDLTRRKREMQALLKEADARLRSTKSSNTAAKSQYERATRELKRRIDLVNAAKGLLPLGEGQVREAELQVKAGKREQAEEKKALADAMRELDIAKIEASRDLKKRELAKIEAEEATAQEEARVKAMALADLQKQVAEASAKHRKVTALYDAGKQERNALVNAIQSASQALAERRERVKILAHELSILRNESAAKDAALQKEQTALQRAAEKRDALRIEANKEQGAYKGKQGAVETQIVTIDRLNGLINTMEREMLALKDEYEAAVEARNYAGVQLIDRNDELCILYEKAAVNEEALKKGEESLRDCEAAGRALRLRQEELERDLRVARARFPELPKVAQAVLELQRELQREAETAARLSAELEDPAVTERWVPLEGADLDEAALRKKVETLEARLGQKREELLGRELILEEVASLGDKLREQAASGREGAADKAQSASTLRGKIRSVSRKIVAVVSEMSMWQSLSVRLGEERQQLEESLGDAEERARAGQAPTEQAERLLVQADLRATRKAEADARRKEERLAEDGPRSTAEARPNAYIPEGLPIPRPYGRFAPMRPPKPGAQMRHFRPPQAREIEI
ncbi:hypothetical protein FNF28_03249 [Cafeteria roenbergensis]|uniref:Cilia- and flagella-associated protein 58 central coiled coil domain-containing protein n=1 Tax=Cafeteria roenbergensis TaxID=33653 RepID=A0A5A8DQA5_CAFRO|nr:hypothetical protein FNF28_03249 [Cafeteria roenbergensis]